MIKPTSASVYGCEKGDCITPSFILDCLTDRSCISSSRLCNSITQYAEAWWWWQLGGGVYPTKSGFNQRQNNAHCASLAGVSVQPVSVLDDLNTQVSSCLIGEMGKKKDAFEYFLCDVDCLLCLYHAEQTKPRLRVHLNVALSNIFL